VLVGIAAPADAGHGGHGFDGGPGFHGDGFHYRFFGGPVFIGPGFWWDPFWYPGYPPYPPPMVIKEPQVYAQQSPPPQSYCGARADHARTGAMR
jgi:hypothetical protein